MREAIEALRTSARSLRRLAESDQKLGYPGMARRQGETAQGRDRAADLLESLANPPETVEELERRGQELTGVPLQADRDAGTGLVAAYWEADGSSEYACGTSVRAAWFAIVGMMEER